jgi:hypothetical protein
MKNTELNKQKQIAKEFNEYLKKKNNSPEKKMRILYNLYGISEEEYIVLFTEQNGECAICLTPQAKLARKLHVDHCHKTDKVRGLLCESCNMGLGLFHENEFRMAKAIDYLRKGRE